MTSISCNPYKAANKKLKKDLERLSSGYRINRAADGAAELAVSQSMRADIVEMKCFKKNTKDGISLIKTAEGALDEVHNMLNRMIELSDQAANGTYGETDRASLQNEVDQLKEELDRIASNTNFNGIYMLNGNRKPEVKPPPVYDTRADLSGVTAKPAVQTGAVWEGVFEDSDLVDGTSVTINGVVFEFDGDGVQNRPGSVMVSTTNAITELSMALGSQIQGLSSVSVAGAGAGKTLLRLEQNDSAAQNGQGFTVSVGSTIPRVTHGTPTLGMIGSKQRLTIDNIDIDAIVDGTVIELFGNKYEVDYDGTVNSGAGYTRLDMTAGSGSVVKRLMDQLKVQPDIAPKGTLRMADSGGGKATLTFTYNSSVTASASDIRFNTVAAAVPSLTVNVAQNGVNTPAVLDQNASRTDLVDFSRIQDGDAITINGHVFEFDADGILKDPGNHVVDISTVTKPSDIADALKAAFDAQSYTDIAMTVAASDDNQASITVTSTAPADGDQIEFQYQVAAAPESEEGEPGIYLQIGPGESGELYLEIDCITTAQLGISAVRVDTQSDAKTAVGLLREAVNKVSSSRGVLGAIQNRLEHTYNNLSVAHENLTEAESSITSADMGEEMTSFTKHQIIAQAAQSMLAQAKNMMASKVQQLLQS